MRIKEFQDYLKDRLNEVEALIQGGCKAVASNNLDILNETQIQLFKTSGVCIVVTTPDIKRNGCAKDAIPCDTQLVIKCMEIPVTNRKIAGHLTALDAAEIVAHTLDGETIEFSDIRETVERQTGTIIASVTFSACIYLTI